MLGAPCSNCCQDVCGGSKSTSNPADEGDWVPSGSWPSVSWTYSSTPSEKEWFFYGSGGTSKKGGGASSAEQTDWGNLCNWYSASSHSPATVTGGNAFDRLIRRATTLPTTDAIIHVYSTLSTGSAKTVKTAYFYSAELLSGSSLTATAAAYGTDRNTVFSGSARNSGTISGGALFGAGSSNSNNRNNAAGTVNGGADFLQVSSNLGTVNDGFAFKNDTNNSGTANGGGTFSDSAVNSATASGGVVFNGSAVSGNTGTVNNGATFNGSRYNAGTVNGGATFNNVSFNNATVGGGATFNSSSYNNGTVDDSATFNDSAVNYSTVNGGATFNNNSQNEGFGTVNGGATFNDAACSRRLRAGGVCFPAPCTRKFVAHPTDLPTCSGTAPTGCANLCAAQCGCG